MTEPVASLQGIPGHIGPGQVIAGKYRLEAEIGKGSMGTVYRAVHVTLGQRVAIKLISSEHSASSEARQRFSLEAKAAAKLRSRHVVQVYDDGETEQGNPYIVLEYLEGETLEERLEREHDIPLVDAVRIVHHVSRALARAHAQGIVHRDLKPANVFLVRTDDDERGWIAKVLDFGIAKLESSSENGTTQAGTVLGTPLFMSPEQVRGASSVDHRADLYSLGMCLYHMLTGDFAYYAPNYSDILIGICTQPLPLLRNKAPWVPEGVERWFQRACAKEPLERFQSADEMSEALSAAAGPMPLAKHQSFPEGRIAPETLMGYAAPAGTTLQLEATPASLGRPQPGGPAAPAGSTLVLAEGDTFPGHAASGVVPIAISPERRATGTGEVLLPVRSLKPLGIGLALGLVGVVLIAVLVVLLLPSAERSARAPLPSPSAAATVGLASATPPVPAPLGELPSPERASEPPSPPSPAAAAAIVYSETGDSVEPRVPAAKPKPKRPPALSPPATPHSGSRPSPARPPSSDLGF